MRGETHERVQQRVLSDLSECRQVRRDVRVLYYCRTDDASAGASSVSLSPSATYPAAAPPSEASPGTCSQRVANAASKDNGALALERSQRAKALKIALREATSNPRHAHGA